MADPVVWGEAAMDAPRMQPEGNFPARFADSGGGDGSPIKYGKLIGALTRRSTGADFYVVNLSKVGDTGVFTATTTIKRVHDVINMPPYDSPLAANSYFAYQKVGGLNVYLWPICPN